MGEIAPWALGMDAPGELNKSQLQYTGMETGSGGYSMQLYAPCITY